MTRYLLLFCLTFQCTLSFAETKTSSATIQKLKETIQSSKTVADFVRTLPGDTTHLQSFLRKYFAGVYNQRFEPASFNLDQEWLQIGKMRLGFSKIEKGVIEFGGKSFTYNPSFFEFYVQVYNGLPKESRMAFWRLMVGDARAQKRDAFPELVSANKRNAEKLDPNLDEIVYMPLMALSVFKYRPVKAVGKLAIRTVVPAIVMYWGLNYAHAYYAPPCSQQIKELKDALAEGKIGLAELSCGNTISSRAKISFWTPDKKSLPFVADWSAKELWVNRDEVYHFDTKKLTSVDIEKSGEQTSISKGSPEFLEYRKNLEPYRKVLAILGDHNSCWKCEREIEEAVVTSKPSAEPEVAPASEVHAGAVQ